MVKYRVKVFLQVFHNVEVGLRIGECEVGYEHNQFFLSTIVHANTREDAKEKGFSKITEVLAIFCLQTGQSYKVSSINVEQLSGTKPYIHAGFMTLTRLTLPPLDNKKIAEIKRTFLLLDKCPKKGKESKRIERAINYFMKGCYLETKWRPESFLNFYKVVELIAHAFIGNFNQSLENQLKNTLLEDLDDAERKGLLTSKRLIQHMCKQLKVTSKSNKISQIVKLRSKFSAHATLEEVDVSLERFNECKSLAGRTLIGYIEHLSSLNVKYTSRT